MTLQECLERRNKYGFNLIKETRKIHISNLIVLKGDNKYGLKATFQDLLEGRTSKSQEPLEVIWILEENKFLLVDGYHRFIQQVLENKNKFICNIDWKGYTLLWKIPDLNERYNYKKDRIEDL